MKRLLLTFAFLALWVSPVAAQNAPTPCGWLSEATLRQQAKIKGSVTQRSQLPERCEYEFELGNRQQIEKENQERLRESMRRGGEPYQPVAVLGRVVLEIRQVYENRAAAQAAFKQILQHRAPQEYGSPDPVESANYQNQKDLGQMSAWSAGNNELLLQQGKYLLVLTVQVKPLAKDNLKLAQALVPGIVSALKISK